MTREQARREIDSLDFYLQNHTDDYGEESHTAMMMAIDALSRSENQNKWMAADVLNHWIGAEVLDKIRAEIADIYCGQYCENPSTADSVREMALEIIDKYRSESEDKE